MRQSTAGSSGGNVRQSSSVSNTSSLKSADSSFNNSRTQLNQSKSEEGLNRQYSAGSSNASGSKQFSYGSGTNGSLPPPGPLREYTTTISKDIPFPGETVKTPGKFKGGGTLAENRRRIAAMLGRKS